MTVFKITDDLLIKVKEDLVRQHPFAFERVGFILCRPARINRDGWILFAWDYRPVDDSDYLEDESVGAMMGPGAMRKALQLAYNESFSLVHVHLHNHYGVPQFSRTDNAESERFVPDFWNVRPNLPHGAVVISRDAACGFIWDPKNRKRVRLNKISIIGAPLRIIENL